MKNTSARLFSGTIPVGTVDISPIINIPLNGGLFLFGNKNYLIKQININVASGNLDTVLKFYSCRFRLLNQDISLNTNLAGNILNPISGPFNGNLPKDTICDIQLNSNQNKIFFNKPILGGGIQFQSIRLIFNSAITVSTNIYINLSVQYHDQ